MKATEKAFNTLELAEAQKVSNIYGLLHDSFDAWFTRVKVLHGDQLTWEVFKAEFCKEYLADAFKVERQNEFIALKQGAMTVQEYMDKFEDLYKYASDIFPTEPQKCYRFKEGL